jgi:transposase
MSAREPGSGDRDLHRRTGPCGLGIFGDDAGGDGPAYHPSTLLKIYLYGYLNRIQSSRRLEREAQRNIELMWLVGRLAPDFKTIADFRKDNGAAIRAVCRQFVELCRQGLVHQSRGCDRRQQVQSGE